MHDRRAHRLLADITALRAAQRMAARQELAAAQARERDAADALRRADQRTAMAASAWDAHLGGTGFAPELARAFAAELIEHGRANEAAQAHRKQMGAARDVAEGAWHDGDARCRLADRALDTSRRAQRRDRDERALAALADRTASKWRRA